MQEEGQPTLLPSHAKVPQAAPAGRGEQVPTFPGRSQASQAPAQAVSQQNPSAQRPVWQSPSAVQELPRARVGAQVPPMHEAPVAQAALLAQVVGHCAEVPLQSWLPQLGLPALPAGSSVQVPTLPTSPHASQGPLQVASQQAPSTQKPVRHS